MRILLLNQFFWPDSAATSQLLTDLARGLAEQGHEVIAIAAGSAIQGGYAPDEAGAAAGEAPPPVRIVRVKALPFARGKLGRVLSYGSFYVGAAVEGLRLPRPDLVLTLTTPPLLSLLGTLLKRIRGSRHFIWEMDMYPDVAIDLGTFRAGGVLDRVVGAMADFSRHRADGIVALGECMRARLIGRGVDAAKISVAENWADARAIQPMPRPAGAGETADRRDLVVLYSGNLGLAHELDTVTGAMRELRQDSRVRFVFAGSGGRRAELARFVADNAIESVEMRPYAPRASLSESLAAGDVGLVTQRDATCGSVVPSKVYGLLAAGRPIVFVGPAEATPARLVRRFGCGWHISVGDVAGLADLLRRLADDREAVREAGRRARQALEMHFDSPLGVARIVELLGAAPAKTTGTLALALTTSEP